jgi:signal transduction histidine kinase
MHLACHRRHVAVLIGVLLLCGTVAGLQGGEIPSVTNLLQLRLLAQADLRSVANINITGSVCEADAQDGFLILQDSTATELVELDFADRKLHGGQKVEIAGENCEVVRRRTGIGLRRLPLVDNDGLHGVVEKSGTVELTAGRHPITVEWFNAGGAAKLSVEFSGPGFVRQKIAEALLTHDEFSPTGNSVSTSPGLEFRRYEGDWRALPDFGSWPESGSGTVSNFTADAGLQGGHVGQVFSGFLTVTQGGAYTFYLNSDDGSRLFLGEPIPRIKFIGETAVPAPRPSYVGQIAGTNDPGRWASVEGQVRYVSPRGRRLELDLRSPSNNRLQVDVMDAVGLPAEYLLESKVRLTGVARQVFSAGGQSILGLLTVGGARDVEMIEVPTETWQAHPLQRVAAASAGTNKNAVARLSGVCKNSATSPALELADDTGKMLVERSSQISSWPNGEVESLGVLGRSGTNVVLKNVILRSASTNAAARLPVLHTAQQVLQLSRDEAVRGYPVLLRGVITCVWPDDPRNYVLQDSTRGIYFQQTNLFLANRPQFGEFWEIQGVSGGGAFSPMVYVRSMHRVSDGRLPEPAHAEWDQLVNGSLDNQYVEIEGVVLQAKTNFLTLLAHSGKISIVAFGEKPPALEQFENKLVRLRGCLQAVWEGQTHQVKVGEIRLGNLAINTDRALSADPFAVPARQVPELRLYDMQANAFRRVKISGQFLQRRAGECFMVSGTNGLRFRCNEEVNLTPGDTVEVAGVADLRGAAPVLHEAIVRKTGMAPLPAPKELNPEDLMRMENDSTRVSVEGILIAAQRGREEMELVLRSGLRTFTARVVALSAVGNPEPGSNLRVTGVYDWHPVGRDSGAASDDFDLLVRSPLDIEVLSRPPWWTFKRLLLASGILAGVLALAGIWIILLRRQVERRTAQLERANRQREQAERARALDEERLRIARDLHDDLGSSLTEITMLGGMSLGETEKSRGDYISQIVKKARDSVNALDVIVWAVNPRENTLQSLADYLASFADDFLSASGIACRLNLPVSFPAVTLDGRTRHDLFLATKEALNNAVRHARATEVELSIALEQGLLAIMVKDNGCGFDPGTKSSAHGLGNLRGRLEKLGGQCQIDSAPGQGAAVTLKLPLAAPG